MIENHLDSVSPPPADPPPAPKGGSSRLWYGLLLTYLVLFVATGVLALVAGSEVGVDPKLGGAIDGITDADLKKALVELVQQQADAQIKLRDLAIHSFNVVLGALLGFLSASAAMAGGTVAKAGE